MRMPGYAAASTSAASQGSGAPKLFATDEENDWPISMGINQVADIHVVPRSWTLSTQCIYTTKTFCLKGNDRSSDWLIMLDHARNSLLEAQFIESRLN